MRFDTSQQMRLGQQMKLAPRMIQSMEILQMPMMALQEKIEQELESNIALELAEGDRDAERDGEGDAGERERSDAAADAADAPDAEMRVGDDAGASDDFQRLDDFERSYGEASENAWDGPSGASTRHAGERDAKMDAMANIPDRGESLSDQLLHQWTLTEIDKETQRLGEVLIGYVDDNGLIGADLATIAEQNRAIPGLEVTEDSLERILPVLQSSLEPRGIAARDAREALLIQVDGWIEEADAADDEDAREAWEVVERLLDEHFDDIMANRMPRIAEATGLTLERIAQAMELMKRLDPSPGRGLSTQAPPPVVADIAVERDESTGRWIARLEADHLPPLRVSDEYKQMSRDRALDDSTRELLGRSVQSAQWLIDAVGQRRHTLLRVARVVVDHQQEFFDKGPAYLKPLPMTDVADQLGVHVATVSRAVADKWMMTPRGLAPLRKMFSGGVSADGGREMSWEAVRATMQEVIDAEDKQKPLSDESIARALKERGIEIARRTVVKYRQQLGIPPARQRRVYA